MGTDSIREKKFHFLSSNNYTEIHGKAWIPRGEVRAVVQISHGMQEYIERYDDFARFLADNGILVVGNDHMGHGKSIYKEDDLGYFSIPIKGLKGKAALNNNSNAYVVKDLHRITKIIKRHYPGVPYIILGHSMGSFMARRYLMQYGNDVDGAIIVGTGNPSASVVKMGKTIIKSLTKVYGERFKSEFVNEVMFGKYNERIKNPKTKVDWICSDENVVNAYVNDEKCGFPFTLNGFEALVSVLEYIIKPEHIANIPKNMKIFIISGKEDPVGAYGEQVKDVYDIYKEYGINDIDLKLYDKCRHEILNEKNKKEVYNDILEWINARYTI